MEVVNVIVEHWPSFYGFVAMTLGTTEGACKFDMISRVADE